MKRRYKHLRREKSRHGRFLLYVRIGTSRRVRLREYPDSVSFKEAYDAAIASILAPPEEAAPPPPRPVPSSRFVYVVSAGGEAGPSKIGISTDPERRLIRLRSGNPTRLAFGMLYETDAAGAAYIERAVLRRHGGDRLYGEWIDATPSQLAAAVVDIASDAGIGLRDHLGPKTEQERAEPISHDAPHLG